MLFLLILVASLIASFMLPWWFIAVVAFAAALYAGRSNAQTFWSGFCAIALLWTALALFKSIPNEHMLATRVAKLFHLPNWLLLLAVMALIGGLVGGLASLSGVFVRRLFVVPKSTPKKSS